MSKKLITCDTDDNVLFVSNLMKEYDVGFILIMKNNKLHGVVTDRDLICDFAEGTTSIEHYANTNILTINEDESIENALKVMKENKVKRLVITNNKKVTGVLSLSDIYNSGIDSKSILEALKQIYAINRNEGYFDVDVHDFLL